VVLPRSQVVLPVLTRDVNETFSFETEMRPRRLKVCSRRDKTFPDFPKTETFNSGFETRPRPFETQTEIIFEMSQTLQPIKLLASNCYKLCCVSFICYAKHSSVSATYLIFASFSSIKRFKLFNRNFRSIFPKTVSNLKKTPHLYSPTFMHYVHNISNHNLQ